MLNVDEILNGVVIDHITAGTGLALYHLMELEQLKDASVALLQNVRSQKSGRKDIIKIENVEGIDLDVLGLVARQATVDIVRGGRIVEKVQPHLPERVVNVITCVNPRCVTTTERGIDQMFHLAHSQRQEYRCDYCDEEAKL